MVFLPADQGNKSAATGKDPWRVAFWLFMAALLPLMLRAALDVGGNFDEGAHVVYGRLIRYFYQGLFKGPYDGRALSYSDLFYYGGFFDLLTTVVHPFKYLSILETRHVVCAFFGWLAILYAARLAKWLIDVRAAFLTAVLLAFSPRLMGYFLNENKDGPFAACFAAAVFYLLHVDEEKPLAAWRRLAKFGVAAGLAIGMRAGGLLLLCYLGALLTLGILRREWRWMAFKDAGVAWLGVAVMSLLVGAIFWPWALLNPLRPFVALHHFMNYAWAGGVLYRGESVVATELPRTYLLTWLGIGPPLGVLWGLLWVGPLLGCRNTLHRGLWLKVLFAAVFPLAFIMLAGSKIYDGERHFVFTLPLLGVLSAGGWHYFLTRPRPIYRWAGASLFLIWLLDPVFYYWRHHPHYYAYFNAPSGGPRAAFLRYDMDYQEGCIKAALKWVAQQSFDLSRPLCLTSAQHPDDIVKLHTAEFPGLRYGGLGKDGDLYIEAFRGSPVEIKERLKENWAVHTEEVDGAPLCQIKISPESPLLAGPPSAAWMKRCKIIADESKVLEKFVPAP